MNLYFSSNLPALFFLLDNPSFIYYLTNDDYLQCNLLIYFRNKTYNEISQIFNNYINIQNFSEIKRIVIYKPEILLETAILNEMYRNKNLRTICNQDPVNYKNYYCIFTKDFVGTDNILEKHLSAIFFFGKNYNYKSKFNTSNCYSSSECAYSGPENQTCSYLISILYDFDIRNIFKSLFSSSETDYSFKTYTHGIYHGGFIPENFIDKLPLLIDSIIDLVNNVYVSQLIQNIDTVIKRLAGGDKNSITTVFQSFNSDSSNKNVINNYLLSGTPPNPNPKGFTILTPTGMNCIDTKSMLTNSKIVKHLKYIADLCTFIPTNAGFIPGLNSLPPYSGTSSSDRFFIDLRVPGVAYEFAIFLERYILNCDTSSSVTSPGTPQSTYSNLKLYYAPRGGSGSPNDYTDCIVKLTCSSNPSYNIIQTVKALTLYNVPINTGCIYTINITIDGYVVNGVGTYNPVSNKEITIHPTKDTTVYTVK